MLAEDLRTWFKEYLDTISENKPTAVIEVTADLVRDLRNRGFYVEANDLVKSHQEQLRINKHRLRCELRSIDNKERKLKYKRNGLCLGCGKQITDDCFTRCESCRIKSRKYKSPNNPFRERLRIYKRAYAAANPNPKKTFNRSEYDGEYYARNKVRIIARQKEWYQERKRKKLEEIYEKQKF